MDEKTKLYVFAKKEVALIFLFMVMISVSSFIFGVKVGKSFSFADSGLEIVDKEKVEILSGQEEKVNEVVEQRRDSKDEKEVVNINEMNKRLEDRIKKELSGKNQKEVDVPVKAKEEKKEEVQAVGNETAESSGVVAQDSYSGKYTIQLGSHQSLKEAKEFAEGFRARKYDPIINEVELANRGTWYRVSIGVFNSVTEAKEYVQKEKSLFQGEDYVFRRFD